MEVGEGEGREGKGEEGKRVACVNIPAEDHLHLVWVVSCLYFNAWVTLLIRHAHRLLNVLIASIAEVSMELGLVTSKPSYAM